MGCIETDSEDSDTDHDPTIYLRENFKLSHESNPYTKEIFIDICQEINGAEIIIGELKGHFFNLCKLYDDKQLNNIISLIHQYDEETFDICNSLIKETSCYKMGCENIYHLDRFFIFPQYRGSGVGRHVLDTFEKNINLFMENNVRYIGLFPDPITDDLEYDSMESMSKEEREKAVKHLKLFYSSLGFVEMKTNPNYMYLDLNHLNLYKRKLSYEVIYQ
ncbi:GNAT family N-acetyltransferase [uncultured Tissierella sp.]|uniref:GNAT family N-acetyltransferase n=1 Tax=uncultured Tissierella sp. TaxID=448160 RepID=UPI0028047608|nr:GNAT family N-acetyltransferase [uncultured Tissierella sp.]MDU5081818.1 GNAT family N-acetyltransferase [Bacillota bacterium]